MVNHFCTLYLPWVYKFQGYRTIFQSLLQKQTFKSSKQLTSLGFFCKQGIGKTPVGEDACPRFKIVDDSDKILVPSGTEKTITVYGENIRDFMTDIGCFFYLGQGRSVKARVSGSEGQKTIECGPVTVRKTFMF